MSDKPHVQGVPAFNLTARDKEILSQTDEEYHLQTWDDLKTIIGSSALTFSNQTEPRIEEQSPDYLQPTMPSRSSRGCRQISVDILLGLQAQKRNTAT